MAKICCFAVDKFETGHLNPIKPEMLLGEDDCGHGVHQSHFRESDLKCFEKEALDLVLD